MNLGQRVIEYLKSREGQRFTAREIAIWVMESYPEACREKLEKSRAIKNDDALLQQLVAEIGASRPAMQKREPGLRTTEGRPRKYYYSLLSDQDEVDALEDRGKIVDSSSEAPGLVSSRKIHEHDLYPLLAEYLKGEFSVYCKRIDEKRSSNRRGSGGNHWLYPDMAAMEDLGAEWHRELQECVRQYSVRRTRLWSFEVKLLLNRSNVRECFFQAVSNSSWANFGYLVAAEITGVDTLKELRMLSAAHGIGVIQLDSEDTSNSQILIPAREREVMDWEMMNRLVEENADFKAYVTLVRQFYQTGDVREADWETPARK
ncbi:HrgA protein [Lysobacteraceae bacterium NML07-0707]|nr:HrgA protein [Xanthomonadaceae bacterium NML07-0707]